MFAPMNLTKIKELRRQKGLTLVELSRRTGIRRETLSLIERGKASTKLSTLENILSALDGQIIIIDNNVRYLKVVE